MGSTNVATLNINVSTLPGRPSTMGSANVMTSDRDVVTSLSSSRNLKCRCHNIVETLDRDARGSCGRCHNMG